MTPPGVAEKGGGEIPDGRAEGPADRLSTLAREHWHLVLVLGIMVAAYLVRQHYLARHTQYTADSYYYMTLARSIRDTFTYTVRGVTHTKYIPGYPGAIWLLDYLLGSVKDSANVISLAGGTLTVLTTYGIGRVLFNKWVGILGGLILAFVPTFLKWTCMPMTEGMFTLLFSLGVYLAITGCKQGSTGRRIAAAAMGGLCFLTRWEGILFMPVFVLIVLLYLKESKPRPWEPLLELAIFFLPMCVYSLRNLIATGHITAYLSEFRENQEPLTTSLLFERIKLLAWDGMEDAMVMVFFFLGSLWCLLRRKWKAFLVLGGWFALFVIFHLFWYYPYQRFMAPATPAIALVIAFLLVDPAMEANRLLSPGGPLQQRLSKSRCSSRSSAAMLVAGRVLVFVVLAGLVFLVVGRSLARSNSVIRPHYQTLADDHGGEGMVDAARWLKDNVGQQVVAADAGPYFQYLYYPGDVLYLKPVPWDLPVEQRDVGPPDVIQKLYQRGIRYVVLGHTGGGLEYDLDEIGITGPETDRMKEVARFQHHYDLPPPMKPLDLTTYIFEILPP